MRGFTRNVAVLVLVLGMGRSAGVAAIHDLQVVVEPAAPTTADPIAFLTSGVGSSGPVEMESWMYSRTGNELKLELRLTLGLLDVMTPWEHRAEIGLLPAGWYDLTTTALGNGELAATAETRFQVVPEPGLAGVVAVGVLGLWRRRRKA